MPSQEELDKFLHPDMNQPAKPLPASWTPGYKDPNAPPPPKLPGEGVDPNRTPPSLPGSQPQGPPTAVPAFWTDFPRICQQIFEVYEKKGPAAAQSFQDWVKKELGQT